MNDLISKATFGFLMAQLFPGAIAVFAIGFAYFAWVGPVPSLMGTASELLTKWGDSPFGVQVFLIGMCIGGGMVIHGLNWAILGALEKQLEGSVFNAAFHHRPMAIQILAGPIRIVHELFIFLTAPKQLRDARMVENIVNIGKDELPKFMWLQDFYLYSAQFFAHVSLALSIVLVVLIEFLVLHGPTWPRFWLFVFLYFLIGWCFVLGRVQFASLFFAETTMADRLHPPEPGVVET